jgi:hypothetical protein
MKTETSPIIAAFEGVDHAQQQRRQDERGGVAHIDARDQLGGDPEAQGPEDHPDDELGEHRLSPRCAASSFTRPAPGAGKGFQPDTRAAHFGRSG